MITTALAGLVVWAYRAYARQLWHRGLIKTKAEWLFYERLQWDPARGVAFVGHNLASMIFWSLIFAVAMACYALKSTWGLGALASLCVFPLWWSFLRLRDFGVRALRDVRAAAMVQAERGLTEETDGQVVGPPHHDGPG